MKRLGFILVGMLLLAACERQPAKNPDPNHTHADFAVWVNGEKLDFSGDEFMSESESEETDDDHEAHGHKHHPYLHLHDGNGSVPHRHKPGLGFGEFLLSIGLILKQEGFCTNSEPPSCYDAYFLTSSANSVQLQTNRPFRLFVNGKQPVNVSNADYVFSDLDQILLTDATDQAEIDRELRALTNNACLYSRTCPERGDPPTENCIADPEVPCVAP